MRSLVPIALTLFAPVAAAQCFDTNFGIPLALPPGGFDFELPIQPIGFAFPIAAVTYTDLHITSKGYVWLSNAGVPQSGGVDITASASELATDGPRVACLWSDLGPSATGQIWLHSSATRCTVTWADTTCYQQTCGVFTMQLQLFPSGEVRCFYGQGATNNSDPSVPAWQVGVVGVSPGGATPVPNSDLSAGGFTTATVVVEEWQVANTFDMANRGLFLLPTFPGWVFGQPVNCAGATTYGQGCVQQSDSCYEQWNGAFDLNNTTVTWLRTGTGYVVLTSLPGTFVTPGAGAVNVAPGALDGEQVFTLGTPLPGPGGPVPAINVTTKGQIELAGTISGSVDFTPTVGELLNSPRTTFALWHDYDQTDPGSGLILFEEVGTTTYLTWNGVHSWSSVLPSTFQFQLDRTTGNVTLVIGTMGGFANPDNGVLGYSVGGPSFDPGATDFSALAGVLAIADLGLAGLALDAVGLPQIGNAAFAMRTSNVPNLVPFAVTFFGTAQVLPGLDLTFLGMPGCFGYTNGNLASASFPVVVPGIGSLPLPIPNGAALIGAQVTCQSVAFSLLTALNLLSSNGLLLTLGL